MLSPLTPRPLRLGAAVLAAALVALLATASPGLAADATPCGAQVRQSWSAEPVQPCPLTSPLANNRVPVYTQPVAAAKGAPTPAPAGWLHGTAGQHFVCQQRFPAAAYHHPRGWRNVWWARTKSDDGVWGWTPEVFFAGGDNDEADRGLRACGGAPAPGPTEPPPAEEPAGPIGGGLPPLGGGGPIDAYRYDNAKRCTSGPSPGALAVRKWLDATFPGSFGGIYNCRSVRGGRSLSLHGEGRAIDWMVNANTKTGRAAGDRIVRTLLARDAQGNANALARRMGVQEIIWNRRIWDSEHPNSGMVRYNGASPHTDHVHIGLHWGGARMQTSHWRR